jgi:hypothetical protein
MPTISTKSKQSCAMGKIHNKIVDYLICYSPFLKDIGLFHGKMGVIVALATYAKLYHDESVKDFVWELYEGMVNNISPNMSIGIESGLAGIGYGITLLNQYGFVDCNLNEILQGIDMKIMEHDPRRIIDTTFHRGLYGLLCYIALREKNGDCILTFDNQYIQELRQQWYKQTCKNSFHAVEIMNFIHEPEFDINEYVDNPLSLDRGSAYYILQDSMRYIIQ